MPWLETNPMDQRMRFLEDVRLARMSITEICAHNQISPKTGYNGPRRRDWPAPSTVADRALANKCVNGVRRRAVLGSG